MRQYDFFFYLEVLANVLEVASYDMLLKDKNNGDIDRHLDIQDNEYLKRIMSQNDLIIRQNKEILKSLKRKEEDYESKS